jgi:hypothetical protein
MTFSQIFKDAMLFFSRGTPNLATVIPAMDHIDRVLATSSENNQYSLSIHASLVIGKNAINRYYNKTDHSKTYHIAMGMCSFIHMFSTSHYFISTSSSSPSQTFILQGTRMGRHLGQHHALNRP